MDYSRISHLRGLAAYLKDPNYGTTYPALTHDELVDLASGTLELIAESEVKPYPYKPVKRTSNTDPGVVLNSTVITDKCPICGEWHRGDCR